MSEEKAVVPAPAAVPQKRELEFTEVGVQIRTIEDAGKLAKWAFESGLLPEQIQNTAQAFVILCKGAELGLPPFSSWNFIYLTKARRLALLTKGALAVVQSKPAFEAYSEHLENEQGPPEEWVAVASAKRKGMPATVKQFSFADAQRAGLLQERTTRDGRSYSGPWQAFVKDMLLSRARGRVLDIAFAAELGGIAVEGVAEDADMMEARRSSPRESGITSRPALAAPKRDPLLDELAAGTPKIIDVQPTNSGPPPAAQPKPGKATEKPATVPTTPVDPGSEGALCPRCEAETNAMGGCDVCGWPGADIR